MLERLPVGSPENNFNQIYPMYQAHELPLDSF